MPLFFVRHSNLQHLLSLIFHDTGYKRPKFSEPLRFENQSIFSLSVWYLHFLLAAVVFMVSHISKPLEGEWLTILKETESMLIIENLIVKALSHHIQQTSKVLVWFLVLTGYVMKWLEMKVALFEYRRTCCLFQCEKNNWNHSFQFNRKALGGKLHLKWYYACLIGFYVITCIYGMLCDSFTSMAATEWLD